MHPSDPEVDANFSLDVGVLRAVTDITALHSHASK